MSSTEILIVVPPVRPATDRNDLTEFNRRAAVQGYSTHATSQMSTALRSVGLSAATAADWMVAGFTPWAVPAWQYNGFSPGEAADSLAHGESPESAYFARLDQRQSHS